MPSRRKIPIRDEIITMGRFMNEVGRTVDKFLQHWVCFSRLGLSPLPNDTFHQERVSSEYVGLDPRWKIGAGGIKGEDVIVIGAINVSADSWMPILQLNRYV